jgi:hypothetical protein
MPGISLNNRQMWEFLAQKSAAFCVDLHHNEPFWRYTLI